jgi:hypothetical protein
MKLKIINATSEKITEGSKIWVEAKLIIVKMAFSDKISETVSVFR